MAFQMLNKYLNELMNYVNKYNKHMLRNKDIQILTGLFSRNGFIIGNLGLFVFFFTLCFSFHKFCIKHILLLNWSCCSLAKNNTSEALQVLSLSLGVPTLDIISYLDQILRKCFIQYRSTWLARLVKCPTFDLS